MKLPASIDDHPIGPGLDLADQFVARAVVVVVARRERAEIGLVVAYGCIESRDAIGRDCLEPGAPVTVERRTAGSLALCIMDHGDEVRLRGVVVGTVLRRGSSAGITLTALNEQLSARNRLVSPRHSARSLPNRGSPRARWVGSSGLRSPG